MTESVPARPSGAVRLGRLIRPGAIVLLTLLSLPIAFYGLAFPFSPELNPDFFSRLMALPWYAYAHFLGSATALLVGGFQFSGLLRQRRPTLHRWTGRVYLGGVLVGGIGGLGLAMISHGGPPTHVAFMLLSVIWLYSGAQAYRAIRAGNVSEHRRWMIRNFALTFAAVTLRIQLGVFVGALGWTFDEAYLTVAWFSWVPNLLVAEWWILRHATARRPTETTSL
ncbi:MAG TPA: DUF2306 domain-containing protein [Pseudomonadales bacterium]